MRRAGPIALALMCLAAAACGSSSSASLTPLPTASSAPIGSTANIITPTPQGSYPGAVVGTWRSVEGETYITESGTGIYFRVAGVTPDQSTLGTVLFAIGQITPVPNVYVIQATQLVSIPVDGAVTCTGTLNKRNGQYYVESDAPGGCGSVQLIETDATKLDPQAGQAVMLTVRACTVTKEGAMVKADLDPNFTCPSASP